MTKESKPKIQFSAIIAAVTLIVSIIAIIPAFLSLNKEKSVVFWSYELREYSAPEGIESNLFFNFLKKNNIPPFLFSLKLKNCGNIPSKEIKFSVSTQGQIVRYVFNPSQTEKPIWVEVPTDKELGFNSGVSNIVQTVQNLAPNRLLIFGLGYESQKTAPPEIEVFSDGTECVYVSDISSVTPWNPYKVFYLPGYILAGGVGITLLWILFSVILSNPEYRKTFIEIGKSFLSGLSSSMRITIAVDELKMTLENIKKKKTEHDTSADAKKPRR